MTRAFRFSRQALAHAALFAGVVLLDQATKYWARARFSLADGSPDYFDFIPVIGDWLHLRLVFNYGAAFGLQPQNILPFLHPVAFFTALSTLAVILFGAYYRRLGPRHGTERLGIALVLAGAVGNNLIDRPTLHKVTDFIDIGIPGVFPRFPVFNVADISVCIGLGLMILPSFFIRKPQPQPSPAAETPGASDAS
jgi:signal peptidase II